MPPLGHGDGSRREAVRPGWDWGVMAPVLSTAGAHAGGQQRSSIPSHSVPGDFSPGALARRHGEYRALSPALSARGGAWHWRGSRGPTVRLCMAPSGPGTATGWASVHISGCSPHSYSLCLPWDHGATLGSATVTRVCTAEPRRGARLGRVPCRVFSQHWPWWEAGAHHGGKHLSGYQRSGWSSSLQPQTPPSPASPVLPSRCPCLGTQHCIGGAPVRRPAQPGPQPLLLAWPGLASTDSEQGSEGSKCCVRLQPLWCLEGAAQAGLGTKHGGLPQSPGPSLDHLCLCSAGCGESPHHSHRNRDGLVGTSSPSQTCDRG